MSTIHAFSYIRFSTTEQRKGDSFRRQMQKTAEYCTKRGWELDSMLQPADLGMGAYRGRNRTHGALAGFLDFAAHQNCPGSA